MTYVLTVLTDHLTDLVERDKRTQNMIRIHESQLKELHNTHYKQQQKINTINEKIDHMRNPPQ